MSWKVLIERGNLGFSAAHFITFEGQCEPLHGHNYGVRVEVEGELSPDHFVLDFVVLKNIVRALCKEWDHRFLLPLENPHLRLTEHENAWEVVYDGPLTHGATTSDGITRYLLPKASVVALPIANARGRLSPDPVHAPPRGMWESGTVRGVTVSGTVVRNARPSSTRPEAARTDEYPWSQTRMRARSSSSLLRHSTDATRHSSTVRGTW